MEIFNKKFANIFDDNDIQFCSEDSEKEGHIEVYTCDCFDVRSLMRSDKRDIFKENEDIVPYGDNYEINFYTEYYPNTDEVLLKVNMNISSPDIGVVSRIYQMEQTLDRVKDGYILLSEEDKDALKQAVKDYAKTEIQNFVENMEAKERD